MKTKPSKTVARARAEQIRRTGRVRVVDSRSSSYGATADVIAIKGQRVTAQMFNGPHEFKLSQVEAAE